MKASVTLSVSIAVPPTAVTAFAADARNLPQWAAGICRSVRPAGDHWIVDTGEVEASLAFIGPTEHGILDHVVTPEGGASVLVPMRVVPNEEGSEVLFTAFRPALMNEPEWQKDLSLVQADLQRLKQCLEQSLTQSPPA